MIINGENLFIKDIAKRQKDIFAEANNKNFDKAALEICREEFKKC